MLLDDLINALSDENQSLGGILLKTKVFLHQIGRKELADWAKFEMSGYPDDVELPEYRHVAFQLLANVSNGVYRYPSHPIPTSHLDAWMKERFMNDEMRQPIATVESWCGPGGTLQRPLPMELNPWLSKGLSGGMMVERAWCEVSIASVANILTQVRSRLLDFLLELKDVVGDVSQDDDVKARAQSADLDGMFNKAVFGPNTTIIVGNNSSISASQSNSVGDLIGGSRGLAEQLRAALPVSGLPASVRVEAEAALDEVEEALSEPNPSRLKAALKFLQKSLEGASGNLIASGALTALAALQAMGQ